MNYRAEDVLRDLHKLADPKRAESSQWFFKTGKGEYGEGDLFYGITVPKQREVAKKYRELDIAEVTVLLKQPYHEARLTAVFILVHHYQSGDAQEQATVYNNYLDNTKHINNWDIVDSSAHKIVGPYLADKPEKMDVLRKLAGSESLWERRIAMISTAYNIGTRKSAYEALELAELLLHDKEDLMHKAVGWMLREVGKQVDESILKEFLDAHAHEMPRTMLRYAIERLDEPTRKSYLAIKKV